MSRHLLVFGSTVGLLVAAGAVLFVPRDATEIHLAALDTVPDSIGSWNGSNHVPTNILPVDPAAPQHLRRTYQSEGRTVWISVGYYPNQADGARPAAHLGRR